MLLVECCEYIQAFCWEQNKFCFILKAKVDSSYLCSFVYLFILDSPTAQFYKKKTHLVRLLLEYIFETVAISLCAGWHGQRGMWKGEVKHWCGGCDDARRLTRRRRLHPPAGAPLCLSFRLIPVLSPTCHIFYCVFWLLVGLASLLATRSQRHTPRLKLRGELLSISKTCFSENHKS